MQYHSDLAGQLTGHRRYKPLEFLKAMVKFRLKVAQLLLSLVGNVSCKRQVEAVGNNTVGLKFNFGWIGKPVGGTLFPPVKKIKISSNVASSELASMQALIYVSKYIIIIVYFIPSALVRYWRNNIYVACSVSLLFFENFTGSNSSCIASKCVKLHLMYTIHQLSNKFISTEIYTYARYVAISNSYNMGTRDLPDIYALARGSGIYIRQIMSAHVISNT